MFLNGVGPQMIDQTLTPRQQLLSIPELGKALLIYHWDTDGVGSAALLLNFLTEHRPQWQIDLIHPQIGNYFLTQGEYEKIKEGHYDLILSVDLNFGLKTIENLEQLASRVVVFDHHVQTRDIKRPGKQDTSFPGSTFLVNTALEQAPNLVSILGMIGDQEDRLQERTDFMPVVNHICQEVGQTFENLLRLTKLVDTNYITLDSDGLERMIQVLRTQPLCVLTDPVLLDKQAKIDLTLSQAQMASGKPLGPYGLEFELDSPLHLLSEYTRVLSRRLPDKVILVTQLHPTYANMYVRRRNLPFDLSSLVELARSKGFNAGGKVEVAGLIIPLDQQATFSQELRQHIAAYGT